MAPLQGELCVQRLGQEIADLALRLGHKDVERRRRNGVPGGFCLDRQEADLRSVAMGQDEFMAHPVQLGQGLRCSDQVGALDRHRALLAASDERVATQRDDDAAHPRRSPARSPERTE